MTAKFYEFAIDRCTDKPGEPKKCKNKDDIDIFIKTMQVQTW
jgi:hypothetical protein